MTVLQPGETPRRESLSEPAGYWLHRFTCEPCERSWSRMPGHPHVLEDECPECYTLHDPHSITMEHQ